MTNENDNNDWQWKIRKNQNRRDGNQNQSNGTVSNICDGKGINTNFMNLGDVSVTIYVTNFPESMIVKDIRSICDRHGLVAYVYIARKLSKIGRCFVFVRFLRINDKQKLLEDLNRIWIVNFHLFAMLERFERKKMIINTNMPSRLAKHTINMDMYWVSLI